MPFRRLTGRFWLVAGGVLAAYVALGFPLENNDFTEAWLYKIGLAAATVIPLAFAAIYTAFGLSGRGKWWSNPLGTAQVTAALSLVPLAAPLAWTFWFDGGNLTPSWLAWAAVSGPVVSALAWLWLCTLWLRVHASARDNGGE